MLSSLEPSNDFRAKNRFDHILYDSEDCPICYRTTFQYLDQHCYTLRRICVKGYLWWKKFCSVEGIHRHITCNGCKITWIKMSKINKANLNGDPVDQKLKDNLTGLNDVRDTVFSDSKAKGWHTGEPKVGDFIANLHGEISELWEAYRAKTLNLPCDKSEKMLAEFKESLTCLEEELADIVVRTLDMAAVFDVDIERAIRVKMEYNRTRPIRHGGKVPYTKTRT